MKTIIIKESEWLRGVPLQGLLRDSKTGRKCCLGFVCMALGFKPDEIEDIGMPSDLEFEVERPVPTLTIKQGNGEYNFPQDTEFAKEASSFNDAAMDDEERKFWLKILAHDAGYDFQFVP